MTSHLYRTLAAALSALAMLAAVPAQAQEGAPDLSWTGYYLGGSVGVSHMSTDMYSPTQTAPFGTAAGYPIPTYAGWHLHGGIHAGFDQQFGQTVLGIRLQHIVSGSGPDTHWKKDEMLSANPSAMTMLSARAGYLVQPDLLGYVNASAVAGFFNYASVDERWGQVDDSLDAIRVGVGIGGGFEFRLSDDVSFFTEFNHVSFLTGNSTFDYGPTSATKAWTYDFTHSINIVQAGVSRQF